MAKLIVWDLDGTLVNSLPATFAAFNDGVEPYVGRRLSGPEILSMFGPSEDKVILKLVGDLHYEAAYRKVLNAMTVRLNEITPFDGIIDALHELDGAGYRLGIFTGRARRSTDIILDHLNLRSHFVDIVTNSEVTKHKPDPEGLFRVCKTARVEPRDAVMIGDSHMDILAGKSAGAITIGCVWDRLASREALVGAQPHHVIENAKELVPLLKTLSE